MLGVLVGFSPAILITQIPHLISFSGSTTRRFVGHSKDVLSVAFSADNRQIVSGSRDKTIKLWNTLGVCKYTIQVNGAMLFCQQYSHLNARCTYSKMEYLSTFKDASHS